PLHSGVLRTFLKLLGTGFVGRVHLGVLRVHSIVGAARPSLLRAAAFYERASYVAGSAFLPNFSLTRRRYRSFVPSIPHMAKRSCYPNDESNRADKQPRRRHKMGDGHCDTALFGFGASQARNIAWFRIVSAWSAAAFF